MKKIAAEKATNYIEDDMIIGLGTGTTVEFTLKKIGELIKEGLNIKGIPTSNHTRKIARGLNIPLTTLEEHPIIDFRCIYDIVASGYHYGFLTQEF